ncbi:MAG: PP2C family protein-serine/threonine phosphatase [Bacteroidota bacterium]
MINKEKYYQEQLDAMRDMMERTTAYMEGLQEELKQAKRSLEERHNEVLSSVNYAAKIQKQLLPDNALFDKHFSDYYWYIDQRDTIGGDFIFVKEVGDIVFFGLFDCTGHGIPGALLSIMGHQLIDDILKNKSRPTTQQVADALNELFLNFFTSENAELKDGMDGIICAYDASRNNFSYTSAGRPLWMKRDGEWLKLPKSRASIGTREPHRSFKTKDFLLVDNDEIFIFSDGLSDQFGGDHNKKFLPRRIMNSLAKAKHDKLSDRLANLETFHKMWQMDTDQTDDISFLGVKF